MMPYFEEDGITIYHKLFVRERHAYSNSALARSAESLGPTAITKTATRETMLEATSRFFAKGITS